MPTKDPGWRPWGLAALVAFVAIAWGASIRGGFVFDDRDLVLENPLVRTPPWALGETFRRDRKKFSYRPVRVISYQVDHLVAGGLDPRVFHASNLLWQLGGTLLLWSLARAILREEPAALAGAALYAVHPLASEAVAYVSGRRDLLCAAFSLLALRSWWWFLERGGGGRRSSGREWWFAVVGVVAGSALAIGSKETALVLPLLAALLVPVARARGFGRLRALSAFAGGAVLLLAFAVLLYPERVKPVVDRLGSAPLAPQPAFSIAVVGRYLRLALWPTGLQADYRDGAFALPTSGWDPAVLPAAASLALVVLVGIGLLRRGSLAGAGLLWIPVALLPVSQVIPYAEVISEHNALLALSGLGLAAAAGFGWAWRRSPRAAAGVAMAVLALCIARSRDRVADWRDEVTLWQSTITAAPGSRRAAYNLGVALAADGRLVEAKDALLRARSLDPDDRATLLVLGRLLARVGEGGAALDVAREAVTRRRDAESLLVLGWAQLAAGRSEEGRSSFAEAAQIEPSDEAAAGLRQAAGGRR